MRVLLTGASGQLAAELCRAWKDGAVELMPLGRQELDVTKPQSCHLTLREHRPDVVINTAAFVNVDACEGQRLKALRVNAAGPAVLASVCAELGAGLVHVGTDYVFEGKSAVPYAEDGDARPVNFYGVTKLLGERAVRGRLPDRHLIVRTSGLYGTPMFGPPRNFVSRILERARRGEALRVVDDQVCCPTSAPDLARVIRHLVEADARGTVHVTNQGQCSWYEFAVAALRYAGLGSEVVPISSRELAAAATRPAYSVLANTRLASFGIEQPGPWREALRQYVASYQTGRA